MTKWSWVIFLEWQNGRKDKNPAIEPCTFTTGKSKIQLLDTDMANITAESLRKSMSTKSMVKSILPGGCTAVCVELAGRPLNMHPPFVVSVAVLITN